MANARGHANRGKSFETLVNYANQAYERAEVALIRQIPTPTKVLRAYDSITGKSKIVSAVHDQKSTVDYMGVCQGYPIAFDAKSTMNKTSFRLDQIEAHQLEFLHEYRRFGGISFFLIEFASLGQVYRLGLDQLHEFMWTQDRKSIPLAYFKERCHPCVQSAGNPLHYLDKLRDGA